MRDLGASSCYSQTVIHPDKIRELIGTLAVQREAVSCKGMFLTTSTFSSGAAQLAKAEAIELVDGARFSQLLQTLDSRD
ncbi:MAG: restriction endonuclease [Betaproteobacteria bacterium]|nr:restriction endonuclease [Betaproteobacteria bacterium]